MISATFASFGCIFQNESNRGSQRGERRRRGAKQSFRSFEKNSLPENLDDECLVVLGSEDSQLSKTEPVKERKGEEGKREKIEGRKVEEGQLELNMDPSFPPSALGRTHIQHKKLSSIPLP